MGRGARDWAKERRGADKGSCQLPVVVFLYGACAERATERESEGVGEQEEWGLCARGRKMMELVWPSFSLAPLEIVLPFVVAPFQKNGKVREQEWKWATPSLSANGVSRVSRIEVYLWPTAFWPAF